MSITLGITSWQEGNSGWVATLNADLNRLASAVDSVSSGNISSGSISPLALNSDNSVTLGGILAVDSTTGHFYVKPSGVNFGDLPGQAGFTGGEIVRVKTNLSGLEPVPDNSISFEKIDYTGTPSGTKIIAHNGSTPELISEVPAANLPQIPIENLPIYTGGGTPLTGYVMKVYVSGGQITYLYPDITANSEETHRIKWTGALTDSPMYGDEFVAQKLPNYANIGKAQESSGGGFLYPPEMSFVGKIHDTDGSLVNPTSASYHGMIKGAQTDTALFADAYIANRGLDWTPLTAATDFSTTAASTSTITMNVDKTATVKAGNALKWKLSGTYYYGQVVSITSNLLTVRGAALTTGAGALTELYFSDKKEISPPFGTLMFLNYFALTTTTTLVETKFGFKSGFKWLLPTDGYLVGVKITTTQDDSAATTQPTIQIRRGSNNVFTSAVTIPDNAETITGVIMDSSQYKFSYGDYLEVSVTAASGGTPAHDSKNLGLQLIFVRA